MTFFRAKPNMAARLSPDTEPMAAPAATRDLLDRLARIEAELLREHARQEEHRQFVQE